VLLPTTDNLLSQFFGEHAYEFDQFSEENDSDSSADSTELTSHSPIEEITFVSISPKPARLPLSDELALVIPSSTPTSPETSPDSPKTEETSSSSSAPASSPSMKRRMSLESEDEETTKRQRMTESQMFVSFPLPS